MITYTFEQRLVPPIRAGLVCQTLRGPGLRHAIPGERIRLLDCQHMQPIIDDPVCFSVDHCEIIWQGGRIHTIREGGMPIVNHRMFARGLGHASVEDMEAAFALAFQADYIGGFMITWIAPAVTEQEIAA